MACRDCVSWRFVIEREHPDHKGRWGICDNEEGTYPVSLDTDHCPKFKERTDGE